MSSDAPPSELDPRALLERYAEERRRLVLIRLRWTALLALVPIVASAVVNVAVFTDRIPERVATLVVQAALCGAALLLTRGRRAARRAIPVAMGLVMGMSTSLFWSLSLSPRDLDVLVGPIGAVMAGSTLLFAWGFWPQVAVSTYVAAGYLFLPPWPTLDAARTANVLISLTLGVATSVVGALVLDRYRRATFVEHERVESLAHQRKLLLDAGRELNGTLELSALVQRITWHGRRLVGSDSASLTLFDERANVFRTVAVSTDEPAPNDDILAVEFPADHIAFLSEALLRTGLLEIPGGTPLDGLQHLLRERFGLARTLYVAIQRDGRLLGFLNFSQRASTPAFGEHRLRQAEGIAHQAAVALANARLIDDLRTASRIKSEFVSTMSHELRTPLHVIIGYTDLLGDLPGEQRAAAIAKIRAASLELLEMIEATLNLNRMEAGRDTPTFEVIAVRELWEELAAEFAALPRKPGLELRWGSVDGGALRTDRRKLKIVLKNLVGNALKFTSAGEVVVAYRPNGSACAFTVRDTGIGIAREQLPFIFDMFRQADSSDSRSYGGAGLGLYIVRRLLDQLGGEIRVESEVGRGSTFTVTVPDMPT
ncbi:MAG TPA: HAMP domain-containing sensor histidine kinase [Candidatus Limnocylindria bacterium]|nr:HAMP domain-containing sensor histidine kinase [Candidatus Limnocylindria bacterium]